MMFTLAGWAYAVLKWLPFEWSSNAAWTLWYRFHSPEEILGRRFTFVGKDGGKE